MVRSGSILFVCGCLLYLHSLTASSAALAQTSPVEELTRVLPGDVLGFVATGGGESLKADFDKSILGRLWSDPGVKTFCEQIRQEIRPKIEQEMGDPNAAGTIDAVCSFARLLLSRPLAVGAARKQMGEGPPVYGFVILDAGPRKAEIASALRKLESFDKKGDIVDINIGSATMRGPKDADDVPLYWGWVGNYLVAAVNDNEGMALQHLSGPRSALPAYVETAPGTRDAVVVYYDFQAISRIVTALAGAHGDQETVASVVAVLKHLGLDNIKGISARMGFAGPDVVSSSLIEIPAPRTGLFASVKTIDMSMFDMVDAGAMNATALNCDLGGMYDTVLGAIKTAAGEDFAEVEQGIAAVESQLKFKIRQGLLESLSGEMVSYSLPSGVSTQSPMGGFVLVAGLKDAKAWEDTLTAIGEFAAAKSGGMVQVSSQEQGGRTVHTWAVMPLAMAQVMPTWTVVGNRTIIASSPAICSGAVEQVTSGTKSIRSTEGFRTATAGLPANLISLKYSDSKLQFTQLMMGLQQFWPMVTMMATRAELKLPMILPNLSHIAEDMRPSCQYSWFDERGLRSRYRGAGVEVSMGTVAGGALGLGIMMPALVRTRQIAFRMVSGTNLSAIGKSAIIYSVDNNDQLPSDLQVLVGKANLPAGMLESKRKPKDFAGPAYIYVAGQNTSMYPGNVLAYENPAYCSDGINVLLLDSHVEWMKPEEFLRELRATYKRLGREMPEIRFMH